MIKLENIKKEYKTNTNIVKALKGIDINFRPNEFVAILGPSGGGKTTLLNIIGGLDHPSSGDLIINGKSTKNFKDRDWDSYRNHSVGFVFQSYNLIPHQTVLSNVELALTISGISRSEKRKKAVDALRSVGLADQLNKKPNQLSGGQMQRVAIARAIVNDPDILLADEPTGALDSETSVQIMEIIKEISADRLVVMVTHNPELAEQYATRTIRLKDGLVISDDNPYVQEKEESSFRQGRASMNWLTSLVLSFNNLLTKKGRTFLTAFAGSIGIIGIALILSLSTGVNDYIEDVQTNSLSSYPLTIDQASSDFSSAIVSLMGTIQNTNRKEGQLTEVPIVSQMFESIEPNDLRSLNHYLEEKKDQIEPLLTSMKINYGVPLLIYKLDENEVIQLNPSTLFSSAMSSYSAYSFSSAFSEMLDNRELLNEQYDVIKGRWPERYDECVVVVQDRYTVTDYFLYSIGVRDQKELKEMISARAKNETVSIDKTPYAISYDDILAMKFKVVDPANLYKYNNDYAIWEDMSEDETYMKDLIRSSMNLNIVGIVCAKEGVSSTALSPGIVYLPELTIHMIERSKDNEIVKQQLANPEVDIFSSKTFEQLAEKTEENGIDFSKMITVDEKQLADAFQMKISQTEIAEIINSYMNQALNVQVNSIDLNADMNELLPKYVEGCLTDYVEANGIKGNVFFDLNDIDTLIEVYNNSDEENELILPLVEKYEIQDRSIEAFLGNIVKTALSNYYAMLQKASLLLNDKAVLNDAVINDMINNLAVDEVKQGTQMFAENVVKGKIQLKTATVISGLSTDLIKTIASSFNVDPGKIAGAFKFNLSEDELNRIMTAYMNAGSTKRSLTDNLKKLGYRDLQEPSSISFYFKDFDSKDHFKDMINEYNETMKTEGKANKAIIYQDITGILMSSVTTIIDAISYILIAFVSVSLVVSSIMIAIITYISVLERTKEIGILRSIGASKKDVRNIFNAETFIVGLLAGVIGVVTTMLLCFPINSIVRKLTKISTITAFLPGKYAIILIIISVVLTMVAGLVPASMASKQDPVIALRNE